MAVPASGEWPLSRRYCPKGATQRSHRRRTGNPVNTPLLLQWRNEANSGWYTVECSGIPVAFPVAVRIDFSHAVQLQGVLELIRKIKEIVGKVQGTVGTETVSGSLVEP